MKKINYILITLLGFMFFFSCKKYNEVEKITIRTGVISAITPTKAFAQGTITKITDVKVTEHGHCWSSANDVPDFRINQGKTLLGVKNSDGSFSSNLTGLFPGTKYYVRSFFIAKNDTIYGNDIQVFRTLDSVGSFAPNVATGADSALTQTSFYIRGSIVNIGSSNVTSYGHCYSSTVATPTIANSITTLGTTNVAINYKSNLTGLTAATTYNVRAYATNSVGTSYGNVVQVTTPAVAAVLPTVTTIDSFAFPAWTANVTLFGKLISTGNSSITQLGHILTTDSFTTNLTITNSPYFLNNTVTTPNDYNVTAPGNNIVTLKNYRYKAFATNAAGTAYGNEYNYITNFKGEENYHFPDQPSITASYRGASTEFNGDLFYGLGLNQFNPNATTGQWLKYSTSNGIAPYKLSYCYSICKLLYIQ
jgi:hypothetical protein